MELAFGVEYGSWDAKKAGMGDLLGQADMCGSTTAMFVAKGLQGANACFINEKGYFRNESIGDGVRIQQGAMGTKFVRLEVRNASDILLASTNPVYFD